MWQGYPIQGQLILQQVLNNNLIFCSGVSKQFSVAGLILIKFQPCCTPWSLQQSLQMISCSVMGLIPTWRSEYSLSFLVLDFTFFPKIFFIVGPHSHCISMDHHWDNTKQSGSSETMHFFSLLRTLLKYCKWTPFVSGCGYSSELIQLALSGQQS